MLQQLLSEIRAIRPHFELPSRIVLEAVLLSEGPVGSAELSRTFWDYVVASNSAGA
jgi:hypothetical protein